MFKKDGSMQHLFIFQKTSTPFTKTLVTNAQYLNVYVCKLQKYDNNIS